MNCYKVRVKVETDMSEPKRPGVHPMDPAYEYYERIVEQIALVYAWADTPERAAEMAAALKYGDDWFVRVESVELYDTDDRVTEELAEVDGYE